MKPGSEVRSQHQLIHSQDNLIRWGLLLSHFADEQIKAEGDQDHRAGMGWLQPTCGSSEVLPSSFYS